jgi:tight adherence protein C
MTGAQLLFLITVFVTVAAGILAVVYLFEPSAARRRLGLLEPDAAPSASGNPWVERLATVSRPFARLSVPDEGWEESPLRRRFMHAGLRDASAPLIYFGLKTLLALLFPALMYTGITMSGAGAGTMYQLFLVLLAAAFGYYLPSAFLARLVFVRQREIFESVPDALDLMTVCIEAGLALDAAIVRVAEEMQYKSPALAGELHLVTLELRAGSGKERALRNFARRTGVEDIDALVAMLIQAERFGTSIADSLRVHADMLRTKRRQKAEEAAAKIALKLLFPLIFFIFPSLLLVLMGPAFIQIYRILLPAFGAAQ